MLVDEQPQCSCGQPLPAHLAEIGLTSHVCSCKKAYKIVKGQFVENGVAENPFVTK